MRRFTELLEDILWPIGIALAIAVGSYVLYRMIVSGGSLA